MYTIFSPTYYQKLCYLLPKENFFVTNYQARYMYSSFHQIFYKTLLRICLTGHFQQKSVYHILPNNYRRVHFCVSHKTLYLHPKMIMLIFFVYIPVLVLSRGRISIFASGAKFENAFHYSQKKHSNFLLLLSNILITKQIDL